VIPTEGFQPSLTKLAAVLEHLRIRFHLTGGIVSIAYGEPRMTQDVDVVLDRERVLAVQGELLVALAQAGFHFDDGAARDAIGASRMFQVLDVEQIVKLDLYVRSLIPGELDRSVRIEIFPGIELPIAARTDSVLSKLVWARHGSHRSRREIRQILAGATSGEREIVTRTAGEMGLADLLEEVLTERDELDV
jgi:hypothetical protein